jgi:2-keto-3-deoxy-L-rhamnonate aldolase RhmA
MGHLGDVGHGEVQDALRDAAAQCRALGKTCGIIGANPDLVAKYVQYGYNWIAIGSDMGFMTGRAQEWLAKARGS